MGCWALWPGSAQPTAPRTLPLPDFGSFPSRSEADRSAGFAVGPFVWASQLRATVVSSEPAVPRASTHWNSRIASSRRSR